jgi:hypothetical protein
MWPRVYAWEWRGMVLVWPALLFHIGRRSDNGQPPRAMACWPLIVLRDVDKTTPWVLNHERIHWVQTLELGIVGFWVWYYGQLVYARWWLGMSWWEAYLWNAAEQEAYLHQHDLDYLKTRPLWAQFGFVRQRVKLRLTEVPGEVVVEKDD